MTTKKSWDFLSDSEKQYQVQNVIDFFQTERDETIGVLAAEVVLDHFLKEVGTIIYNQGINDANNIIKDRLENVEVDVESLKK